jgi:hypothetical protein
VRRNALLQAPRLIRRCCRSEFHDSFRFNSGTDRDPHWLDIRTGDCVCVYVAPDPLKQPVSDPDVGNEYCRVLELWEDKKGEDAGYKAMLVRWHVSRRVYLTLL